MSHSDRKGLCGYVLKNKEWEAEGYPGDNPSSGALKCEQGQPGLELEPQQETRDRRHPDAGETSILHGWHGIESGVDELAVHTGWGISPTTTPRELHSAPGSEWAVAQISFCLFVSVFETGPCCVV